MAWEIVVGTRVEAIDTIPYCGPCRQHEDWRLDTIRAPSAADVEAIHSRKHHVKDHGVELTFETEFETALAIVSDRDVVLVVLEKVGEGTRELAVVFYQQDVHLMSPLMKYCG